MDGAKRPLKREREQLRATWRSQGQGADEIAARFRQRYRVGALVAYRWACGMVQDQVADAYNQLLSADDQPVTFKTVSDWERWPQGGREPSLTVLRRLAQVFGTTTARLVAAVVGEEAPDQHQTRATAFTGDGTLHPRAAGAAAPTDELAGLRELAGRAGRSAIEPGRLETIDLTVDRLCRDYSHTAPAALRTRLAKRAAEVLGLYEGPATLSQRRELLVDAGWLWALLACVQFDLGQRQAAEISRVAAFEAGKDTSHSVLMAWAMEIAAWFALVDKRFHDAVDYARAGQDLAGDSSAAVQLAVQEARAWARLGDHHQTMRALRQGQAILRKLPVPAHPEHHFVFDQPKLAFYIATISVWLGDPDRAEEHAREVIQQCDDPAQPNYWPTRVATAHIELSAALAQRGEIDHACHIAGETLASRFMRGAYTSTLWRAADLDQTLMATHPDVPHVREFHEQYINTRLAIRQRERAVSGAAGTDES